MLSLKQRIYDHLQAATPDWFSVEQLVNNINIPQAAGKETTVARALRKLRAEGQAQAKTQTGTPRKLWAFADSIPMSVLSPTTSRKGTTTVSTPAMSTPITVSTAKPTFTAAIEALVLEYVTTKKAFSAYNITTELRNRSNQGGYAAPTVIIDSAETGLLGNGNVRIDHDSVKVIVHEMFDQRKMDGYDRTLKNGTYWEYSPINVATVSVSVPSDAYDGSSSI